MTGKSPLVRRWVDTAGRAHCTLYTLHVHTTAEGVGRAGPRDSFTGAVGKQIYLFAERRRRTHYAHLLTHAHLLYFTSPHVKNSSSALLIDALTLTNI